MMSVYRTLEVVYVIETFLSFNFLQWPSRDIFMLPLNVGCVLSKSLNSQLNLSYVQATSFVSFTAQHLQHL